MKHEPYKSAKVARREEAHERGRHREQSDPACPLCPSVRRSWAKRSSSKEPASGRTVGDGTGVESFW